MAAVLRPAVLAAAALAVAAAVHAQEDGHAGHHSRNAAQGYSPVANSGTVYGFHSRIKDTVHRLTPGSRGTGAPSPASLVCYDNPIVAKTVNTDYRTRPASAEVPHYVRGNGIRGQNLPIGQEENFRDTMPADYMPTDLVLFPREYSYYRQPAWVRQEAADAALCMIRDAEREGLTLRVFSAYRDYRHQSRLKKGGGVVAKAGESEHQLGTTVDVTRDEKTLMKKTFAGTAEGQWLRKNAFKYGFRASVVRRTGDREEVVEPWHLRYYGPGNAGGPDTRPIAGATMGGTAKSASRKTAAAPTVTQAQPPPAQAPASSKFSLRRMFGRANPQR